MQRHQRITALSLWPVSPVPYLTSCFFAGHLCHCQFRFFSSVFGTICLTSSLLPSNSSFLCPSPSSSLILLASVHSVSLTIPVFLLPLCLSFLLHYLLPFSVSLFLLLSALLPSFHCFSLPALCVISLCASLSCPGSWLCLSPGLFAFLPHCPDLYQHHRSHHLR